MVKKSPGGAAIGVSKGGGYERNEINEIKAEARDCWASRIFSQKSSRSGARSPRGQPHSGPIFSATPRTGPTELTEAPSEEKFPLVAALLRYQKYLKGQPTAPPSTKQPPGRTTRRRTGGQIPPWNDRSIDSLPIALLELFPSFFSHYRSIRQSSSNERRSLCQLLIGPLLGKA